jgi:hypothetical protein
MYSIHAWTLVSGTERREYVSNLYDAIECSQTVKARFVAITIVVPDPQMYS